MNNNNYSIVGNKRKVTLETNSSSLNVVGNNCTVIVKVNYGILEVVGNDCRVEVTESHGTINVVGSKAIVSIGRRWKGDKVQVLGPNCHLAVGGMDSNPPVYAPQLSPFSKAMDDAMEAIFTFVKR